MGKIRVLDTHLANQIAAGEVVERPASVVKELMENAIDAEATRIQVEIKEGGISFIQVSDNGTGMEKEDAELAFCRHATSKIKRDRDLFSIATLGFRGEALPSIASIARVQLTTCTDASLPAYQVCLQGGEIKQTTETVRSQGTDVVVQDLFYNTPARLKYLKTIHTEVGHVADVVGRLALAHPHIAFYLSHQGRELFRTQGDGNLRHVLYALYGKSVSKQMVPVEGRDADFHIHGFLSKPDTTRASRSYLSVLLNGRYVRSYPVVQSILRAYGTLLPSGRYPIGALHISMDPRIVDVNVHPAKLEVRMSKEKECCQLIEQAVREAFQEKCLIPTLTHSLGEKVMQGKYSEGPTAPVVSSSFPSPISSKAKESEKGERDQIGVLPGIISSLMPPKRDEEKLYILSKTMPEAKEAASISYGDALSALEPTREEKDETEAETEKAEEILKTNSTSRLPEMTPLGQIHNTYIIAQSSDGFYLLDQHAAHERVYYEEFFHKLGQPNHSLQSLLIPLTIELSLVDAEVMHKYLDVFQQWGLTIEPFGGTAFVVREHPTWFSPDSVEKWIDEMLLLLKKSEKVDTAMLRDSGAKMMACKAAIKANQYLRQDEMEQLIAQLHGCDNPFTCPHGRPVFVHFSSYELEKMFKRVM